MMKAKTPPMTEHQLREAVMTQLDWELSELARLFHSTLKIGLSIALLLSSGG
jgi:hypothetical protein